MTMMPSEKAYEVPCKRCGAAVPIERDMVEAVVAMSAALVRRGEEPLADDEVVLCTPRADDSEEQRKSRCYVLWRQTSEANAVEDWFRRNASRPKKVEEPDEQRRRDLWG